MGGHAGQGGGQQGGQGGQGGQEGGDGLGMDPFADLPDRGAEVVFLNINEMYYANLFLVLRVPVNNFPVLIKLLRDAL